jgi:leucyl-tRNA synthetase
MPDEATQAEAPEANADTTPEQDATPEDAPKVFDADYVKQLRAENAKWRVEAQQAREKAEEYEEAQKSEIEKAQSKAEKEAARAADAQAKLLRYEVAQEKSVPAELIPLLSGSDREALEAQADLIVSNVAGKTEPTPEFDGGAREPAPDSDPAAAHDQNILGLLGLKNN